MAFELIGKLKELFEGDPAVRRVADDPSLSAEILLLFRMILADGHVSDDELATLKRICAQSFGLEEEGLASAVAWLQDYGYETGTSEALATFRAYPRERRRELAVHLADIAKADAELNTREVRLLSRTLEVLGLDPGDVLPAGA